VLIDLNLNLYKQKKKIIGKLKIVIARLQLVKILVKIQNLTLILITILLILETMKKKRILF